jgi:hypothetical protein
MAESETLDLVVKFLDLSLPKAKWTHAAHLRVGLWHLLHHPAEAALALLRERICRYNLATGGQNTDTAGYHETITRCYVRLIAAFVASADRSRPLDDLGEELVRALGDKELLLRWYSKERLFSVEARRGWVEPDLGEDLP